MKDRFSGAAPAISLILGILIILASYYPVLAPLQDGSLLFTRGDFTTIGGNESGAVRMEQTLSTFSDGSGRRDTNRFFLLGGLSALSSWISFTDAQFNSALILLSTVLGCIGIFFLMKRFVEDWRYCSAAILMFIPFYFLNLWSVERIGHIWIWFTYAIFPLFASIGFSYLEHRKDSRLVLYSLVFAFYGAVPHSFIYLGMIHGLLAAHALATGWSWKGLARFVFVPLIIYVLLYLPFLLASTALEAKYPVDVTKYSFTYLSKNGDMANLLTFTNNWWPSLDEERIQSDWASRHSAFGIFIMTFATLLLAYPHLGKGQKTLSLLCAFWMMGCMFVAQGNQNQVLKWISDNMIDAGLGLLLGPFREWARISLLIPLMMVIILSIGLSRIRWRMAAFCILAALIAANNIFSPSWDYLEDIHGAVRMGDEFSLLGAMLPKDSKVLWVDIRGNGLPATSLDGIQIRVRPPISNAGDTYQHPPIIKTIRKAKAPEGLLGALNIHYVVKRAAGWTESWYPGMECSEVGYFKLCDDGMGPEPFRVYEGTILAGDTDVLSLSLAPLGDYAPSQGMSEHAGYVVWGNQESIAGAGQAAVYILEGESAFGGKRRRSERMGASNNSIAIFNGILQTSINISRGGMYRIALIGTGPVEVSVNGKVAAKADSMNGFSYGEPVYLEPGPATISAKGNGNASLDVVWLYEDTGNTTMGKLFQSVNPPPASVVSFERDGPTRWKARINATRPFLLGFAESYQPGWEARIIGGGRIVETVKPVELYGAINGYWINRTGDLEVEMRYQPQDMFEAGLYVASATLVACIAFLAHALWRGG
jgi:hypothetical protein